eukprot:SAG31_NODE_2766_length_5123_cov_3.395900_2_plen_197_part_00
MLQLNCFILNFTHSHQTCLYAVCAWHCAWRGGWDISSVPAQLNAEAMKDETTGLARRLALWRQFTGISFKQVLGTLCSLVAFPMAIFYRQRDSTTQSAAAMALGHSGARSPSKKRAKSESNASTSSLAAPLGAVHASWQQVTKVTVPEIICQLQLQWERESLLCKRADGESALPAALAECLCTMSAIPQSSLDLGT